MPCGDGTGPLGLGPGVWRAGFFPGRRGLCRWWYPPVPREVSPADEKAFLRWRARLLEEELAEINARLEELSSEEKRPE